MPDLSKLIEQWKNSAVELREAEQLINLLIVDKERLEKENIVPLLQYESLRKNFSKLVDDVMGDDYYNMAMDVYDADRICCEDITRKANMTILQRLF